MDLRPDELRSPAEVMSTKRGRRSLKRSMGKRQPGDPEFEELFDAEFTRCVRVAQRIVGDPLVAEDLAAESFARTWARWRRVRKGPSPGAFAVRVTMNLALDHVRRGGAPSLLPQPAPVFEDLVATRLALAEALRRLPDQQRAAVTLRYLADWDEAAVATALGISNGTVKTHLHRGVDRLRATLAEEATTP